MRKISVPVLTVVIMLITVSFCFAGSDDIIGVWNNQEKDARVEIYRCKEAYCGKIVWLKIPDYPEGSKEGAPGTAKLDHNNPDLNLRKMPLLGVEIMRGFSFEGDNLWKNGTVYDPKNGKTYSGKMTLVSPSELHLRGFIGFSWIGRTAVWTR